jgi:two-component system, OmpR family, sensor histidine kinase BaeS
MELDIDLGVNKMQNNLRRKLVSSYMLVALMCIILISILANFFLARQFQNYVIQTHQQTSRDIISSIDQQYNTKVGWNKEVIQNIGITALESGLILVLKDSTGKTIWDANLYNNGMCQAMLGHMSQNMMKLYPNWKGNYREDNYPLEINSQNVGTAVIGYYGPFYYSDSELMFISTLNKIFIGVGIISLLLALIVGVLMAEGLSRPILQVITTAGKISQGDYSTRSIVNSNITEIKGLTTTINSLAETLQNQETLRKRLTSDISHELRTPLATLQSHMEAILDGIWEPTPERIYSCHEEIMRLSRMVGDLERLAKYEGENLVLIKSEFNFSKLIKNILLNFENEYLSKGIDILFESKDIIICADKDKVSQIVINLVSNALKYTKQGGKVIIEVNQKNEFVELVVNDNGMGIPDKDIPYIFERFYRADKSRNRFTGGAGIGLTITKSLVQAHKGKIMVESELNKGTTFRVILPSNI